MSISYPLKLRIYPDPALAQRCEAVMVFDESLHKFCAALIEAMEKFGGAGLAANQVGVPLRVFAMAGELSGGESFVAINPRISERDGSCEEEEGCLSLPGVRYRIKGRSKRVTLDFQDASGTHRQIGLDDIGALCAQHEIDHLDGVTMLDRLSPLKAGRARAKLIKTRRP